METVEVVIKIPKNTFERLKNMPLTANVRDAILEAVENGTVLPKGHGVLKDVTNLMRGLYEEMQTDLKGVLIYTPSDVYSMIDEECPTIIEADEENKYDY